MLTFREVAERPKCILFVGTTGGNFEQQEKLDTSYIEYSEVTVVSRLFVDIPDNVKRSGFSQHRVTPR